MANNLPVIGVVLDASNSIDNLTERMSSAYDTLGFYSTSHPDWNYRTEEGDTKLSWRESWETLERFRSFRAGEDIEHDELTLYGLGTSAEGAVNETSTLSNVARLVETTSSGLSYFKWELQEDESSVGSLGLRRYGPYNTYITSQDWLWTSENGAFFEPTEMDLLPLLESGLGDEDWTYSVYLLSGDKTVTLGDQDDSIRTFYPSHYRSNNGYHPNETDRSPTGMYKGGSVIDGGKGFDRLVYDDGSFYSSGLSVPRSDAQKFLRDDFEISVKGDPANHKITVTNTKFGWTDTVIGVEELEFAAFGTATGSVRVNVTPVFTNGADVVDFNKLDFDELLERVGIGYPVDHGRGGKDHVRLPDDYHLGLDGLSMTSGETNNFNAGQGSDTVIGSAQQDFVRGGKGDDFLFGRRDADKLFGEDGDDWVEGNMGSDWVSGGAGNDSLFGGADDDFVEGGAGKDQLNGEDGKDTVHGGSGNDRLYGGDGKDKLEGGTGADLLKGDDGNDTLRGGSGGDRLYGASGHDRLEGGRGDDELFGGTGKDTLDGGIGEDMLKGAAGADTFAFATTGQADGDVIIDFEHAEGDRINLRKIDANTGLGGDQAFNLIDSAGFSETAQELRSWIKKGNTYIAGDTDGDGVADFRIMLEGKHDLVDADFLF